MTLQLILELIRSAPQAIGLLWKIYQAYRSVKKQIESDAKETPKKQSKPEPTQEEKDWERLQRELYRGGN